jgi:hypothetical protein
MLDPHGKNVSLSRMMQQQMMMQPLGEYVASSCALSEFVGACPTSYKWRNFKKHPGSLGKTCICTMDQNWRGMLYLSHQKLQIIYIYSGKNGKNTSVNSTRRVPPVPSWSPDPTIDQSPTFLHGQLIDFLDQLKIMVTMDCKKHVDFFRVFWRYGLETPKRQK